MMGEAWTVESFLVRTAVEMPGGVRNFGWDFDREWVLSRMRDEVVEEGCPSIALRLGTTGTSEGDPGT